MLLRIQTAEQGTKRVEVKESDTTALLYQKAIDSFQLPAPKSYRLFKTRDLKYPIQPGATTIQAAKLRHGDMIFLMKGDTRTGTIQEGRGEFLSPSPAVSDVVSSGTDMSYHTASDDIPSTSVDIVEDEVDKILGQMNGQIEREKNTQLCRCVSKKQKCVHCVPLDPWDEQYLNDHDPPIKFLSFHSYVRKLRSGVDKGKFVFLEDINCQIIPGCTSCPGWPKGICSKCQPNAVTLSRQAYRHVDYVSFQNSAIISNFLNFWRKSGYQRAGYLYGKYEPHLDVPLGTKAVVYCIYEPPQNCTANSIEFLDDPDEELVDRLAQHFGLLRVGWIFTDLIPEDITKGTVKCLRGADSYFLSAEETITAAFLQTKHPHMSKLAKNGSFGSKFVTVCATGNSENQIHFEAYQISNQGMALVRDNCLVPTHDCPELASVKESSAEQYVPDVFYKYKDEFGNERTQLGRPLPIEYLLIDLPSGFPKEEVYHFHKHSKEPFPGCNRDAIGEFQNFGFVTKYFNQFSEKEFFDAVADFQLLIALAKLDAYPLMDYMEELIDGLREQDRRSVDKWARGEHWQTVSQLMQAQGGHVGNGISPSDAMDMQDFGAGASGGATPAFWDCQHCTFHNNEPSNTCEMCGLPRN